jgi:cytochrome b involved in lipid metabolism
LVSAAPEHPGGADYVTNFCGQDATNVYANQHPIELLGLVAETKVGKFPSFVASSTESRPAIDQKEPNPTEVPASAVSSPSTAPCFSLTNVQQHATRDDCWYMLYGEVWDFTDYIDQHPGGAQRVFDYCGGGTLTEAAYSRQHDQNLLWKKVSQHYLGLACTEL